MSLSPKFFKGFFPQVAWSKARCSRCEQHLPDKGSILRHMKPFVMRSAFGLFFLFMLEILLYTEVCTTFALKSYKSNQNLFPLQESWCSGNAARLFQKFWRKCVMLCLIHNYEFKQFDIQIVIPVWQAWGGMQASHLYGSLALGLTKSSVLQLMLQQIDLFANTQSCNNAVQNLISSVFAPLSKRVQRETFWADNEDARNEVMPRSGCLFQDEANYLLQRGLWISGQSLSYCYHF